MKAKKYTYTKYAPNQLVGVVIQTDHWHDPMCLAPMSRMTVRFMDGTEGMMPMPVIAKPGDRFVFTITPA